MSDLVVTDAGREAMLQGLVARGDGSRIHFLSASDGLLAVIQLATPCGALVGGVLSLQQQSAEGDLIAANGLAVSAQWIASDNAVLASGAATGVAGAGPFKIDGAAGSAQLYAGGRAFLGATALT